MDREQKSDKAIDFVKKCVEGYRQKLLDTSKRNNLIAFKHSERSRQHVRIIDELPDFLYQTFLDGKALTFKALPEEDQIPPDEKTPEFRHQLKLARLMNEEINALDEDEEAASDRLRQIEDDLRDKVREELGLPVWREKSLSNVEIAKKHHLNPSYEMPEPAPGDDAGRHVDNFIQTLLKPAEMGRKLGGLNSYIRSDIEETGVNTLYAAFGFLQWYEAEASDKPCLAPLLLLQLEIKKKQSRQGYRYSVQATGEEPGINLPLSESLRKDFGIKLPEFPKGKPEKDKPENYMAEVADLIEKADSIPKRAKWRIRRHITIGRFRFARLVMFHDLDDKKWPENTGVSSNRIVQDLFGGSGGDSNNHEEAWDAEEYPIDTPEVEKAVPLLITSADASQHSALVDAMEGKNLVIKGPPGTGKSQTITNIIANALAKRKTVLFLAEKMAALNVVYKRLNHANLDPYCLELHSTKARKAEALKSIEERLKLSSSRGNSRSLASKIDERKRHNNRIVNYVEALNSRFGRQNRTVHDYLWALRLRKDRVDRINGLSSALNQINLPFEQANLTEDELKRHTDELQNIASLKKQVNEESNQGQHPWSFVGAKDFDSFQRDELKQSVELWREELEKCQSALNRFSDRFGLLIQPSSAALESFLSNTRTLVNWQASDLDQDMIASIDGLKSFEVLLSFVGQVKAYQSAREKIRFLKDAPAAMTRIKEIEDERIAAEELNAKTLPAAEIGARIGKLEEDLRLWKKSLEALLKVGERFGVSEDDSLSKIYALVKMPDYVASLPRDHLFFRTKDVVDEANAGRFKMAARTQERIRKQRMDFELSMMGKPHELHRHAQILNNAGLFSFLLDPSYRQARKLYRLASKHQVEFDARQASEKLHEVASAMEDLQKIEWDTQLKDACGSFFNGAAGTDFDKLQKTNEWASDVRRNYAAGDQLSRSVRMWLLSAEVEELDSARDLLRDDYFIALKGKIAETQKSASPDTPVKKYLNSLEDEAKKLSRVKKLLQEIAASAELSFADLAEDLPRLRKAAEAKIAAEAIQAVKPLFDGRYAGANTDIRDAEHITRFIADCLSAPEMKNNLMKVFFNKGFRKKWQDFMESREKLQAQHKAIEDQATQLQAQLQAGSLSGWREERHDSLISLFADALSKPGSLESWADLNSLLAQAAQGLSGALLGLYNKENLDYETLALAFEHLVYEAIVRKIYQDNLELGSSKGLELERAREWIKKLDDEIMELQQSRLCDSLNKRHPLSGIGSGSVKTWTEGALIKHEINKKTRHVPIRDLMKRAGKSIQTIKPCFLMSPLTVAQYLEPGKFSFDLMIIDEASQMRPEDALGGIARARQLIVVGDPMQLPPTSFFQSTGGDREEEEEELTSESIIDIALSSFRPPRASTRALSRHYRSRDESLIKFSNHHFYDKELILFPAPVKDPLELGVRSEYVGGVYKAHSNMKEVEAIVKGALDFMRKYPDRSLGLVAMNQRQRDFIEEEMDLLFIKRPVARKYKERWQDGLESFFVKSLENVQGDERDAIFISTVYGPNDHGVVMQRFGPINQAGGHRRLNVLFTRAKKNMVVFTSLRPKDINVVSGSSEGVKALKGFLAYASEGIIEGGKETHREPDSDFEVCVKERLESIGCEVHPQVGVDRYRIDLGVKHPKYPYGYLVGIECDGATYHSFKSARERDIIRQQVLEDLGWRIYRIWSTDWFSSPTREFEKLKNYIEGILRRKGEEPCGSRKLMAAKKGAYKKTKNSLRQ